MFLKGFEDCIPLLHEGAANAYKIGYFQNPAVSEFVTSKQVSITLQCRGAGSGGGSP
jgi:hypothetical protein